MKKMNAVIFTVLFSLLLLLAIGNLALFDTPGDTACVISIFISIPAFFIAVTTIFIKHFNKWLWIPRLTALLTFLLSVLYIDLRDYLNINQDHMFYANLLTAILCVLSIVLVNLRMMRSTSMKF